MLTAEEFSRLLHRPEGESLDFKRQWALDTEEGKLSFVKDVLALANTLREETAYILIGVDKHTDGNYDLIGVDEHPDDADLQNLFRDRIAPVPRFVYYPIQFKGMSFGVLEVALPTTSPKISEFMNEPV